MLKSTKDVIKMRILGIDPGIATIGFGVLDSDKDSHTLKTCGVITTPAHTSLSSRLEQIYDDMLDLLEIFKPDAVSIEELFFNTNITTGIAVAHGRGVILLACRKAGVQVYEYTPLQVKQAVVGYGRAEKGRSWRWSSASASCPNRRSRMTPLMRWRSPSATQEAPHHSCSKENATNALPYRRDPG